MKTYRSKEIQNFGIKKGQPFEPDARMKKLLTEAVAIGNPDLIPLLHIEFNSGSSGGGEDPPPGGEDPPPGGGLWYRRRATQAL